MPASRTAAISIHLRGLSDEEPAYGAQRNQVLHTVSRCGDIIRLLESLLAEWRGRQRPVHLDRRRPAVLNYATVTVAVYGLGFPGIYKGSAHVLAEAVKVTGMSL